MTTVTFEVSITKRDEVSPFWTKNVDTRTEAERVASLNRRLIDRHKWEHTVTIRPIAKEDLP